MLATMVMIILHRHASQKNIFGGGITRNEKQSTI